MRSWKELYAVIVQRQMSPEDIVAYMDLSPSRLRRMLASKHLAARLGVLESVAGRLRELVVRSGAAMAACKMAEIALDPNPELARRGSADILAAERRLAKTNPPEVPGPSENRPAPQAAGAASCPPAVGEGV